LDYEIKEIDGRAKLYYITGKCYFGNGWEGMKYSIKKKLLTLSQGRYSWISKWNENMKQGAQTCLP
jgi:hypothetical protein